MSLTSTRSRDLFLPLPPLAWRMVAVGYVLLEAVLGAIAFSSDTDHPRAEVAAFVLALPMVVAAIPVIYVVGAAAWNVRDGLAGQPMWPVTLTFAALFAATAVLNVVVAWLIWSSRHRR